ncbi:hypothetical protein HKX48_000127 [Thoreauomyces humboldtii]|nr:hypothetical protein HKX48_000127 [Thoreauomyces humboldtii]
MSDTKIVIGQRYKASASYQPNHGDEIRLVAGQIVSALHSYDDGWVLGKNEITQETGLLPGNFLVPIDAPDANSLQRAEKKVADKRKSSMQPMAAQVAAASAGDESDQSDDPDSPAVLAKVAARTVASFSVSDLPSGTPAGPVKPPAQGSDPTQQDQEDASKKLADIAARKDQAIKIPSNIESLKLLFVGDAGIGRSALIRSFLKAVEVVESTAPKIIENAALPITQTLASTIPLSHLHTGEDKLNLSFLEPPGLGSQIDAMRVIRPTVEFNTRQFQETDRVFVRENSIPDATILRFLNSGTGAHTHVDVCVYAILHRLKAVDLEYMRQLAPGVVLVPVIVKSDTMRPSEVFALKVSILEELWRAGIEVYGFGLSHAELLQVAKAGVSGAVPFAVSNLAQGQGEEDHHGAASSGIVDEFDALKDHIFYRADELRQKTAQKFVSWRSATKS